MVTAPAHDSSIELAQRLNAHARVCQVVDSSALSSSIHEVVLRGDAGLLGGVPGNDVMIRLASGRGAYVRRRYSVREVDGDLDQLRLWICTNHDGPGSQWARDARAGDEVDVVGPRGKIEVDRAAQWHLFVSDMTGFSASYRMAESLESGEATFIFEVDHDDDARTARLSDGLAVKAVFVAHEDRARHDPAGLLRGLADVNLGSGHGRAYLFGEFAVNKVLRAALLDRGLSDEQISHKHFWRQGRANADHGEPDKNEV